jgi:hypothetical protein
LATGFVGVWSPNPKLWSGFDVGVWSPNPKLWEEGEDGEDGEEGEEGEGWEGWEGWEEGEEGEVLVIFGFRWGVCGLWGCRGLRIRAIL